MEHQLSELSASAWDQLRKAVREGDTEQTLALIDELQDTGVKSRASLSGFVNIALTVLAEKVGEDAVLEATKKFVTEYVWDFFGKEFQSLSPEGRLRRRARVCTAAHGVDISVEEDEQKYVLTFLCSTGGVIAKNNASGRIKGRHHWPSRHQGIPYFCMHCLAAFELMPTEINGHPWWIAFPPKKAGDVCTIHLYKDIKNAPTEYY